MAELILKPFKMTDVELILSYQRTTGRGNDMVANALCSEIKRRDLDI